MKHSPILLLGLMLLLGACSGKENKAGVAEAKGETGIKPPYYIDLEKALSSEETVCLSTISDTVTYIPLETSSQCLLKWVRDFAFFDQTLLITDGSDLYQYDVQGKFIQKVGQKGQGPEDHLSVTVIFKDDNSHTFTLFTRKKLMVYDRNMQYVKSVRLEEDYYMDGLLTPWGTYFMYLGAAFRLEGDTATIYSYSEIDPSGKVVSKIPNPSPIVKKNFGMTISDLPLYTYKGAVRYMDYGNDILFTLSPQKERRPYAICHLGSLKRQELSPFGLSRYEIEAMDSQLLVNNICEDDRYLYISMRWGLGNNYQYALFDKTTGEVKNIGKEGIRNDKDGGVDFFPKYIDEEGTRMMIVPAEKIVEKIAENKRAYPAFATLQEDDNPVFMLVK